MMCQLNSLSQVLQVYRLTTRSLLTIKGAPDVLIARCTHFTGSAGDTHPLDENTRSAIEEIKDQWSSQGRRVILLARKILSREQTRSNDLEAEVMERSRTGLTLVGLVSIVDPPRSEIPEVVRILRGAGIRIFMVCPLPSSATERLGLNISRSLAILRLQPRLLPEIVVSSATNQARSRITKRSPAAILMRGIIKTKC